MKNKIKIMMMFTCLYSSMGLESTTKVPVPQSLKPQKLTEMLSDLVGITSPCDRVQQEFLINVCVGGKKFPPVHKQCYVDCMKSNPKYRNFYNLFSNDRRLTPLIYAASHMMPDSISDEQAVDIVQMFIEGGIDLNAQVKFSGTALDCAISKNNYPFIRALFLVGATHVQTDMNSFRELLKRRAAYERNEDEELYYFDPKHPRKHQDMLDLVNKNMAPAK
jgi:hypothetical protein